MSWQTITLLVPDEPLKEALIGEFSAEGVAGVWERPHPSGLAEVVFYFGSGGLPPRWKPRILRIFQRHGYRAPDVGIGRVQEVDWAREWRKGFSSFPIGRRFRVVPGWEQPPESDSRIVLGIDPGMAFGTGTHETTRMVLEILEERPCPGPVLDVGTGSGILTVAAAKLGAERILACDLDGDAVAVARANLARNDVVAPVFRGTADAVRDQSVALVLANLTSEAILGILPEVRRILRPSGSAVFSGILSSQALAVEEAVRHEGFALRERVDCGEWVSLRADADPGAGPPGEGPTRLVS